MNNISLKQIGALESQKSLILNHLQSGKTINPLKALRLFNCFRLGARIADLRKEGYNIETTIMNKGVKRFAEYSLVN